MVGSDVVTHDPFDASQVVKRFSDAVEAPPDWPMRCTLTFPYQDAQLDALRHTYRALAPAEADHPGAAVIDGWTRVFITKRDDGIVMHANSGNYGLGFTITSFTLLVRDEAWASTLDHDFDNCAPEGGVFEVRARSPEGLERVVDALVAWHAERGVALLARSEAPGGAG